MFIPATKTYKRDEPCQTRDMYNTRSDPIVYFSACCPHLLLTIYRQKKYVTIWENVVLVNLQVAVGCMLYFLINSIDIQVETQCTL